MWLLSKHVCETGELGILLFYLLLRSLSHSFAILFPAPLCLPGESQVYPCSPAAQGACIRLSARPLYTGVPWASLTPRDAPPTPALPAENCSPPPRQAQRTATPPCRSSDSTPGLILDSGDPVCQEVLLALLSSGIEPLMASQRLHGNRLVRAVTAHPSPGWLPRAPSSLLPTGSSPHTGRSESCHMQVMSPHSVTE